MSDIRAMAEQAAKAVMTRGIPEYDGLLTYQEQKRADEIADAIEHVARQAIEAEREALRLIAMDRHSDAIRRGDSAEECAFSDVIAILRERGDIK